MLTFPIQSSSWTVIFYLQGYNSDLSNFIRTDSLGGGPLDIFLQNWIYFTNKQCITTNSDTTIYVSLPVSNKQQSK